jgi:GT2 family glycosyltransferase
VSVSVIIPSIGRESLTAAIASCEGADEIIVVFDNAHTGIGAARSDDPRMKFVEVFGGDHGYTARTRGMELATSTHLAFLDDDDVYTPGAIDLMRSVAPINMPVIFRMDHPQHGILWRGPVLEFGNVGTPMFLVPNDPARLGVWAPHAPGLPEPGGDFTFITGCVEAMGEPIWRDEVTSIVRPDRGPSIAIVTPWWNHLELWPDYDQAVAVRRPTDELLVVDNGSMPPLSFAPLSYDENRGFARASNAGLHAATADAVLFLNNDVRAAALDWLDRIRGALEPGVLVGAQLRHDPHGDVDGTALPYLDGWCLAGMRDDLLELGGFDESFDEPSYYGDNDLSFRARAAGMRLREVRAGIVHKLNGTARRDDPQTLAATLANRGRFERRVRVLMTEEVAA